MKKNIMEYIIAQFITFSTEKEYNTYRQKGITTIPTMCVLTIKNKDGHPDRAKARIVVFDNQDKTYYTKMISMPWS